MTKLRICLVASEVAPFAKTGGLADVGKGLSAALHARGHDVLVVMPMYGRVRDGGYRFDPVAEAQAVSFSLGERTWEFSAFATDLPGSAVRVVFVHLPELFGGDEIYTAGGEETLRFAALSCAAIELCQRLGFAADVFHCNDWHTALLPFYLRTRYAWDRLFDTSRTLLTIHNIGYQGTVGVDALPALGLDGERHLLDADDLEAGVLNPLRNGIRYADAVSTVSRTYASELLTAEFGMGLEASLRARREVLTGIVNGCDYEDWDPATDRLLPHRYSAGDLSGKAANKAALLAEFSLPHDDDRPLVGVVSRLTYQKGFELAAEVLPVVLQRGACRLLALGTGEPKYEQLFQDLRDLYPDAVGYYRGYSNELAHRIEAAADLFLMPSRYEPCGLNQMYSLKYGTIPVVRRTGGLADTVEDCDPRAGTGTGFLFDEFRAQALFDVLVRALELYHDRAAWAALVQRAMAVDWSWQRQVLEYEALYCRMLGSR